MSAICLVIINNNYLMKLNFRIKSREPFFIDYRTLIPPMCITIQSPPGDVLSIYHYHKKPLKQN